MDMNLDSLFDCASDMDISVKYKDLIPLTENLLEKVTKITDTQENVFSLEVLIFNGIIRDLLIIFEKLEESNKRFMAPEEVSLSDALDYFSVHKNLHLIQSRIFSVISVVKDYCNKTNLNFPKIESLDGVLWGVPNMANHITTYIEDTNNLCLELNKVFIALNGSHYPFYPSDTWTDDKERKIEEGFIKFYFENFLKVRQELLKLVDRFKDNRLDETTPRHWASLFDALDSATLLIEKGDFDISHCDKYTRNIYDSYLSNICKIKDFFSTFRQCDYPHSLTIPLYDRGFCLFCFDALTPLTTNIFYNFLLTYCLVKLEIYPELKENWKKYILKQSGGYINVPGFFLTEEDKSITKSKDSPDKQSNSNPKDSLSNMDRARHKIDEMIISARDNKKGVKEILRPYVAGIRARIIINSMSHKEFNDKYETNVRQSSFSEYCPKGENIQGNFELKDTEAIENELRELAGLSS